MLPLFLYDYFVNGMRYEFVDLIYYTISFMLAVTGMIFLTLGVKYGKGGVCQAIENLKVLWHVLIMIIVTGGA